MFKPICAIIGFAAPIANISAFSVAHYGMLEIGFADDIGTNCILSGKAIAVVDPSLFCYLTYKFRYN